MNIPKYPKPKRIAYAKTPTNKRLLSPEEVKTLLKESVIVEEKMDGKQTSIIAGGGRYILYAEDLHIKHSILYRLPGRWAVFDILDMEKKEFLEYDAKIEAIFRIRRGEVQIKDVDPTLIFPVPLIEIGKFESGALIEFLDILSAYAIDERGKRGHMEGIVVKPNKRLAYKQFLAGKMIRQEFEDGIREHYIRRPIEQNIIDPNNTSIVIRISCPNKIT